MSRMLTIIITLLTVGTVIYAMRKTKDKELQFVLNE